MLNIVLFGPPGAGKGTQSNLLIDKYNLVHLSTGDILRGEITGGTILGLQAKAIMDRGWLGLWLDLWTWEVISLYRNNKTYTKKFPEEFMQISQFKSLILLIYWYQHLLQIIQVYLLGLAKIFMFY